MGRIEARLAVPAGGRDGRVRGYATRAERHAKAVRLQSLKARLAAVGRRLQAGAVPVVRGGRALLRKRGNLAAAGVTEAQWRGQWGSAWLFLTADGEKDKALGQRDDPLESGRGLAGDQASRPARPSREPAARPVPAVVPGGVLLPRGRGGRPGRHGGDRYDISHDPARDRWYLDASWKAAPVPAPSLDDLRQAPVLAVDVNHGHLAVAAVAPDGNILGAPATIGLDLAGRPATARDGRLRAAVTTLIATAREHGARAVVIEDLDFAAARAEGRERHGSRPSRGRRGRAFRRLVSGIPTGKFRDRLAQMAANAGLSVIVVDPAYTSRWGAEHWLAPLREHHPKTTGHHAAALVTGRRGLGHRARRRAAGNRTAPEEAARPAPARPGHPRQPGPHKGSPPPHETPGSHPAPRPAGLTGPRQATRQPRTVRGRRRARTMSC